MLKCFCAKPVCKHRMDCLSVKCLSFVVRQLGFAICLQDVLVGASVRNMQGCTMSTGQQPGVYNKETGKGHFGRSSCWTEGPLSMFILFLHVAWNNRNPNKRFFCVLTCMLHAFLEERCVAGGTVLFALHVSGRRQFKRGTCDVKESFFWHVGTKDVLHVLFQTNLKPNDSDVKHCSLVKPQLFYFCEALAYAKHSF